MGSPEYQAVPYLNLAGGINQGPHPAQIGDTECADLLNFYPWGDQLLKRSGRTKVNVNPGTQITSIFALSNDDGWALIVGQLTGLSRRDGAGLVALNVRDGSAYAASTSPWRSRQYAGVGYAVRPSTGTMKRFKSDFMEDAGIPRPLTAPAIAQGVAGNLPAAAYYAVFTYYNTETGVESNPSDPSPVLNLAGSKKINYTGITASPTGQANARRIYRTLPDQVGQYFFMGQIDNNVDTAFTGDDVIEADLGRRVSVRNGLPPTGILFIAQWQDRMWLADENSVFPGEQFLPECFYSLSELAISPDDGHKLRGLHEWGDRLIIAKTNAVYYLTGSNSESFDVKVLSDRHGCVAPDSLKSAEGILIWFEGSNFYSAVGNAVASISDTKVRDLIDAIDPSEKQLVVAAMYPRLGQYRASIPQGEPGGGFRYELVYNYRSGVWTVFDYPDENDDDSLDLAPIVYGDFYDENYTHLVYAGLGGARDGIIYDLVTATSDDGNPILGVVRPKRLGLATGGNILSISGGLLLCPQSTGETWVRVYRNGSAIPYRSSQISIDTAEEWKPFNLSSSPDAASTLDFQLEHSGIDDFKLQAIVLNRALIPRAGQPR